MTSTRSGRYGGGGVYDERGFRRNLESPRPSFESDQYAQGEGYELKLSSAYTVTQPRRRRSRRVICAAITAFAAVAAAGTALGIVYSRTGSVQGADDFTGAFTEIFSYFGIGGDDDAPDDAPDDVPTNSPTYYPTYSPTSLAEEESSISYAAEGGEGEEAEEEPEIAYATESEEAEEAIIDATESEETGEEAIVDAIEGEEAEEAIDDESEGTGEDVTAEPPEPFGSYRKFGDGMCADANMVGYSFVNFGDFRVKGKIPDDVLGQIIPRIYEIDSAADCPRLCEVAGLNTVGFSYTKSKRRPIPGVDGVKVQSIACSCLVESADLECDDSVKEGIPWECNSDPNGIGPIKFAVKGTGVESVCYENISFKAVSLGQVELPSSKSSKPTPESTEVTAEQFPAGVLDELYLSMYLGGLDQSMSMSMFPGEPEETKKKEAKSSKKSKKSKGGKRG